MSTTRLLSSDRFYQSIINTLSDNPLHTIVRKCNSVQDIEKWMKEKKREDLERLAKESNAFRLLPIDLVKFLSISSDEKNKIYQLLHLLTSHDDHKISDISDKKSIEYDSKEPFYNNLKIAFDIINYTRSIIKASATHPESNVYSDEKKSAVLEGIENLKAQYFEYQDILFEKHIDEMSDSEKTKLLSLVEKLCKKIGMGNCLEFAYLGLSFLLEKYPDIHGEIYRIGQGDHWFLVLGRRLPSDEYNPEAWGETAVICDPFTGDAYPAKEIFTRLKDYRRISIEGFSDISCLVPFNRDNQYIERWLSVSPIKQRILKKSKLMLINQQEDSSTENYKKHKSIRK